MRVHNEGVVVVGDGPGCRGRRVDGEEMRFATSEIVAERESMLRDAMGAIPTGDVARGNDDAPVLFAIGRWYD